MASFIPVIDLANDSPQVQATAIKDALGSIGFFEVRNSALRPEDIAQMFNLSSELFRQPQEEKERFPANEIGSGYVKPHEQALGLYKRDNKEAFQYGRQSARLVQPLPKPFEGETEAAPHLKGFYKQCHQVSEQLLELFAMALGLPYEHFRKAHSFGLNTAVSMIHYPPIPAQHRQKATQTDVRSGEHKDWGTLTMLFQRPGGQPGLQVYLPVSAVGDAVQPVDSNNNSEYSTDGQWGWYDAPVPPSGAFLVNVGLAMELWSGGAYKATLHRVVFPTPKEGTSEDLEGRYSIAYFVQPDDEVQIQPVLEGEGGKVDTSIPAITSKALFGGKLQESLDRIKNMPESQLARSSPSQVSVD